MGHEEHDGEQGTRGERMEIARQADAWEAAVGGKLESFADSYL